jgi:hypothetical protein
MKEVGLRLFRKKNEEENPHCTPIPIFSLSISYRKYECPERKWFRL